MAKTFKQLIESGVNPASAKKDREEKYDVKDRIRKLAGLADSDVDEFDIDDIESRSFDNVVKSRSNTEINRGENPGNPGIPKAVQEEYKAGSVKLKDGTLFELDEIGAHCLNKMLNKAKRPESLDKVARKNSKEFTSILQFAKSLGESADLVETSKEKLQRYVDRAVDDHDKANFARRNADRFNRKTESDAWSKKEDKRKKGISKAVDKLYPKGDK